MDALVIIGALAARAIWAQLSSWSLRICRPVRTNWGSDTPAERAKLSALPAALGKRNSIGDFSRASIMAVRMTRWGAPSIAVVTTVPVSGVSR